MNIEPTRFTCTGTPAFAAAAASPSASAAERASSRSYAAASELLERRVAGGHRERVSGERSRLVDRPRRRDPVHHVGPPAERADRQPAADDLAERDEVRAQAVEAARAARATAGSRSSPRRR